MRISANNQVVPVLMFHSVGLETYPWVWNYISEPVDSFEAKVALLERQGFKGIFWSDLYEYMSGDRDLPRNSILLTFDDGYLDNWVYVYPILKKYGMKGTIFVNPDFVDPRADLRRNFDDVLTGACDRSQLDVAGFLSWPEMRAMERTGLIDIQSHALTHTWYFNGPKIVGFHSPHPVPPHPWLFWNEKPERKPFYLTEDQQDFLPWGHPVFEHEKALVALRFFPDQSVIERVVEFVSNRDGFFDNSEWRTSLECRIRRLTNGQSFPGQFESEEEQESRIEMELGTSKSLIEQNLGKQVDYVCWPGGGNDERVQRLAKKVGYRSWTLSSTNQARKRNVPGADPGSIKRIGTTNQISIRGKAVGVGGARYQLMRIEAHRGSRARSVMLRLYKLSALARYACNRIRPAM